MKCSRSEACRAMVSEKGSPSFYASAKLAQVDGEYFSQ